MSSSVRKSAPKKRRRLDWHANHILIKEAFYDIMRLKKRAPQLSEIASRTDLDEKTIKRHIEEMEIDELAATHPVRLMTDEVLAGIARSAANGSAPNAEIFLALFHGWHKRHEISGLQGGDIGVSMSFDQAVQEIDKKIEKRVNGKESSDPADEGAT